MIKILSLNPSKDVEYVLGTSIEIEAILNTDKPSSITISILDPASTLKTNAVAMTRVNSKVYNYIYQSASADNDGVYIATVTVTNAGQTAVRQITFTLVEQQD